MDIDTEANNVSIKWQGRMRGIPLRHVRPQVGYALAYMLFFLHLCFSSAFAALSYDDAEAGNYLNVQALYQDSHETQKIRPNGCFKGIEAYGLNLLAS